MMGNGSKSLFQIFLASKVLFGLVKKQCGLCLWHSNLHANKSVLINLNIHTLQSQTLHPRI